MAKETRGIMSAGAVGVAALLVLLSLPRLAAAQAVKVTDEQCRFDQGERSWQVTIPNKAQPVRGLFVNGNPGTGDLLNWTMNPFFRVYFAARFGFGMVASKGVEGSSTYGTYAAVILKAIDECAKVLAHPELSWAPLIPMGNSSGGTNAWGLTMFKPERILAFAVNIPGTNLNPASPPDAALKIPGMVVLGQNDRGNLGSPNGATLQNARSKGALWAKVEMENIGHQNRRAWHFFHAFFEHVIPRRLDLSADPTAGPVVLKAISEETGYLADDATWSSGLTKYSAYGEFVGNKRGGNTSWLLDEDIAFLHQGFSSRGRPFELKTADLPVGTDDSSILPLHMNTNLVVRNFEAPVELLGTASDASWTKMELYRGAKKIAEVTGGGATFKFTVDMNEDPPAVWAFSVRGTLPSGVRPSQMLSVLIKPNTGQDGPSGVGGMAGAAGGVDGGTGGDGSAGAPGGESTAGMGGMSSAGEDVGGRGDGEDEDDGAGEGDDEDQGEDGEGRAKANGCQMGAGNAPPASLVLFALALCRVMRRRFKAAPRS